MTEHRDTESETEAQIRRALRARAEETIVSPDALDSIRTRRAAGTWARPATYAAVAAVIVLIAGIALLTRDDSQSGVESAASTTTAPATTNPPTTLPTSPTSEPPPTTPFVPDHTPGFNQGGLAYPAPASNPVDVTLAGMALAVFPVGIEPASAAGAFAAQLEIDDPEVRESTVAIGGESAEAAAYPDARIVAYDVLRRNEDGSVGTTAASTIVLAALGADGPWHVTHVMSPEFTIDSVEDAGSNSIRVTGSGRAFEGTALLHVADEPPLLLSVGGVEHGGFAVIAPRPVGVEELTIRIVGTTVFEGEVPDIAAFRTIPVAQQPVVADSTYSVFGVADDDVLNVRSGAGVTNDIVDTLAPDATGVLPTGERAAVGSESWWEIELADGTGWANSRFLVANPEMAPGVGGQMLEMLGTLPSLDEVPFAEHAYFGGIGVFADFPTPWTSVDAGDFDELRNWSPEGTDDRTCDCDMTVVEFLGFDTAKWELAETSIDELFAPAAFEGGPQNHHFATGLFPEFAHRFVIGSIYIGEPNPEESLDWRHYTVVFDFEDGSPVIRGIYRWGWTP